MKEHRAAIPEVKTVGHNKKPTGSEWAFWLHSLDYLTVTAAMTTTAAGTAAAAESGAVFVAGAMARGAYMTASIPCLVSLKMLEGLGSARGHRTSVTVTRIVAVIDVTIESAGTVEPGTSSDEESAGKPVWPIVAVGGAVVGCIVEVPVGTDRGHSNVDGNLRGGSSWPDKQRGAQCGECEYLPVEHIVIPPRPP
jgi:hypothetical protein